MRFVLALALCAVALPCAAGQWLDSSVITFPQKVDRYSLVETQYDPNEFVYGVASHYTIEGAPFDLKLDVYVYPLGRNEEKNVVDAQIADVENGVKEAAKQGLYTNPVIGARTAFLVVRPDDDEKKRADLKNFDPTPNKDQSRNSHGVRQAFGFERDGHKMRSLGYVFYRSLFGLKVRISVPEDEMSQADFEAAADRAARWLVPQIDVQSFGTCGNITINTNAKDAGEEMMREVGRVLWESCAADKGKWTPPEGKSVEIVYPAGTWSSSP